MPSMSDPRQNALNLQKDPHAEAKARPKPKATAAAAQKQVSLWAEWLESLVFWVSGFGLIEWVIIGSEGSLVC